MVQVKAPDLAKKKDQRPIKQGLIEVVSGFAVSLSLIEVWA